MSNDTFEPERISAAAIALRDAVAEELATHPSGKSRRSIGSWRSVVAQALGRKRLISRYYKQVVDEAKSQGLLAVQTRGGRDYLVPVRPVEPAPVEEPVQGPEDASEAPRAVTGSPGAPGAVNPDPVSYRYCSVCGSLSDSGDPNDLYFDSHGVLCCNGCNDMIPPDLRDGRIAPYMPEAHVRDAAQGPVEE